MLRGFLWYGLPIIFFVTIESDCNYIVWGDPPRNLDGKQARLGLAPFNRLPRLGVRDFYRRPYNIQNPKPPNLSRIYSFTLPTK